ncbi:hypothetical protein [Lacisediminihabitans changchengi]|uniref:Uncharacterized protein n=1 Tax=Lacisediminihabitans changchengi TaxID=2787634 RepID=A0A934VYR6_9MICO|nr:hypothetical protein [Lacisediminihabitans changchengi]MBK4348332.1 hypothetical protein [Lacisediminihabitans changchengi]
MSAAFDRPDYGWREPSSLLPLRWGGYRGRYLAAIALLVAGALLLQLGSVYTLSFLGGGIAAHIAGWILLPGRGNRRAIVAVPSALGAAALLIGPTGSVLAVIPLLAWLWTRERPPLTWAVAVLPVAAGLVLAQLFPQYGAGAIVAGVSLAIVAGSAWLARTVAVALRLRRTR